VHSAVGLAIAPGDARLCVLDERSLGDGHALWEYELGLGTSRLVATFPVGADMSFTDLSYSMDGQWILLCGSGRCRLVRVSDGLTIRLPVRAEAAAWNPRNGPDALILMVTDRPSGCVVIQDYDLSTNTTSHRSTLRTTAHRSYKICTRLTTSTTWPIGTARATGEPARSKTLTFVLAATPGKYPDDKGSSVNLERSQPNQGKPTSTGDTHTQSHPPASGPPPAGNQDLERPCCDPW
jgi:hypothetical protein